MIHETGECVSYWTDHAGLSGSHSSLTAMQIEENILKCLLCRHVFILIFAEYMEIGYNIHVIQIRAKQNVLLL